MEPNVNIGVNLSQTHISEPAYTLVPPIYDVFDKKILKSKNSGSIEDFVVTKFSFQVESDIS